MGKCILHFDRIEIIDKKSDNPHPDNDWMIVHWFVGTGDRRCFVLPLADNYGAVGLESGATARPLSLEVDCADDALVTAVYQLVNLSACEPQAQARIATDFAQRSVQVLTQAYVEAAEFMAESQGPVRDGVFDGGSEELRPAIRDSLDAAFAEQIIPLIEGDALSRGHCNGNVLHDIVLFPPMNAMLPLRTRSQTYVTDAKAGCGRARTVVQLTLERRLQAVSRLSSAIEVDDQGDWDPPRD